MSKYSNYSTTTQTVSYDPTGTLPANLITNEVTTPITEPDIFFAQGPFYQTGLIVMGTPVSGGSPILLQPLADYNFSPLYSIASANTGRNVYSFILLENYTLWSSISVTYQAVGGAPDTTLLANVASAIISTGFVITSYYSWAIISGSSYLLNPVAADYDLNGSLPLQMFSNRLNSIAANLQTPNALVTLLNSTVLNVESNINSINSTLSDMINSLVPIGTVIDYCGITPPGNFLPCYTSATYLVQSQYPLLYNVLSTKFGPTDVDGSGNPTFVNAYFPLGFTSVNGPAIGSQTVGQVINHTHSYTTYHSQLPQSGSSTACWTGTASDTTGNASNAGANNLAAGVYIQKCIRYK